MDAAGFGVGKAGKVGDRAAKLAKTYEAECRGELGEDHPLARVTAASARLSVVPDVLVVEDDRQTLFLYERYTDRAAFDAHRATPHFAAWRRAAAEHLVPGSQVNTFADLLVHHA